MADTNLTDRKQQFLEAYDSYNEVIFKHCYFRLFNRERAKDIMQHTFMKAWEQIVKGVEVQNIKAFLYRVATNLIIDEVRKKKTVSLDVLQEKGFDPSVRIDEKVSNSIDGQAVKKIIEAMDEKYREVLLLRYVEDMSVKEIAAVLALSQNVISVRIYRGLKELKKLLSYE